ncbi:hypothetical protein E2C01_061854 [Portunus trituberculatus]|uniref:Uncharacterized protein n=1 Tax=Portunus trituberculatus TaxID=210409 RepID=A0A5B7HDJ6_PORTR|nr:hypothetical protein [Portunus trituberculatus]
MGEGVHKQRRGVIQGNSASAVANQRLAQQRWMVQPITCRAGRRYVTSHASFTPPTTRHQLLPPPFGGTYPGCDRHLRRDVLRP